MICIRQTHIFSTYYVPRESCTYLKFVTLNFLHHATRSRPFFTFMKSFGDKKDISVRGLWQHFWCKRKLTIKVGFYLCINLWMFLHLSIISLKLMRVDYPNDQLWRTRPKICRINHVTIYKIYNVRYLHDKVHQLTHKSNVSKYFDNQ